jgi:hypothetical protein
MHPIKRETPCEDRERHLEKDLCLFSASSEDLQNLIVT